jgi:hypothetical protein
MQKHLSVLEIRLVEPPLLGQLRYDFRLDISGLTCDITFNFIFKIFFATTAAIHDVLQFFGRVFISL